MIDDNASELPGGELHGSPARIAGTGVKPRGRKETTPWPIHYAA
jgi:hypothetical protein